MHKLMLLPEHVQLVINALMAVSPSEGGSDTYELACRIQTSTGIHHSLDKVIEMQNVASRELD